VRNAEATKERILEAAMAEFSAYGIAGARVDRIAKAAECNKNLIYIYFESKEALFTTLLQKHLVRVYEEVSFTSDDLPGYAVRMFDFAMAHPELMRLLTWFSLEQSAANPAERGAALDVKLAELLEAQEAGKVGTAFSPSFLVTAIMALATAWTVASPFGVSLQPDATKRPGKLRKDIANAVRLLIDPKLAETRKS
jgi:AcrR family transcriptional regulator